MATDTKQELDHQAITASFKSSSSMESVKWRMAFADELSKVHKVREAQCNPKAETKNQEDEKDNEYIIPTTLLILRREGWSLNCDPTPYNVYTKKKTSLPQSVLDKNGKSVGNFLLKKYIC